MNHWHITTKEKGIDLQLTKMTYSMFFYLYEPIFIGEENYKRPALTPHGVR